MMQDRVMSRRTVLKGLGTALALPLLDAMIPTESLAVQARKMPLNRMAFFYVPNGIHMQDWRPKDEGADFQLPLTLEPLKAVKDELTVLTGLTLDKARPNGDGAGGIHRAVAKFDVVGAFVKNDFKRIKRRGGCEMGNIQPFHGERAAAR